MGIVIVDMYTIFVAFFFHQIVPTPEPREDLIVKAWPYDPEIPPMIFLPPNVTVPGKRIWPIPSIIKKESSASVSEYFFYRYL